MNASSIRSLGTTVVSLMTNANTQERETESENRFMLNLTRMSGKNTSSVTPDCILEFLAHIHNSSIADLQFIEEAYTSVIFEDDNFMNTFIHICSVEMLIKRYEEAKEGNNVEFLNAYRVLHRKSRQEVLDEETKSIIRVFIRERKSLNEMKLVQRMVSTCIESLTRFRRPYMTAIVRRMLPLITDERNIQAIQNNEPDIDESSVTLPNFNPTSQP